MEVLEASVPVAFDLGERECVELLQVQHKSCEACVAFLHVSAHGGGHALRHFSPVPLDVEPAPVVRPCVVHLHTHNKPSLN